MSNAIREQHRMRYPRGRSWGARLLILAVAVLVLGGLAAPAAAAPDGATTLQWRQLGLGTSVHLDTEDIATSVSVPVPEGMTPTVLSGVVASATHVTDSFVQVARTDGTIVATIRVPRFGPQQLSTPFSVPLTSIPVSNGRADLRLTLRNFDDATVCGPDPEVTFTNLSVSYAGTAQVPDSIHEVFGSVVSDVTIYTPQKPSAAVTQTTLGLVAAIADHYRPQRVSVNVVEVSGGRTPRSRNPLERTIVVREESGPGGVRLEAAGRPDATLVVSGDQTSLPNQVALFRDNLTGLAQTTSAAVNAVGERQIQGSDSVTFGEFSGRQSADVLGTATLVPGFDPTTLALGRPGEVNVHLRARYTPVVGDAYATVTAISGGEVLYTTVLNSSGTLDSQFTIPAAQVAANEPLEFKVSYEPRSGGCLRDSVPLTFQIDPSSTASSDGTPVRMGGFSSIPLGWQPTVQVAMDGTDPGQLNAAAQLISSVQRSSAMALSPVLVDLDQAINSNNGALIVADAAHAQALDPPLGTEDSSDVIDLASQVSASIPQGLGTIQAFAQNSRNVVLVSTSGSWDLVDPLFTFLDEQDGELANLRGDVLAAGRAGQTELMTVRADGPRTEVDQVGTSWVLWLGISVAVVALAVLIAVGSLVLRKRLRATGATDQGDDARP
ncbi:cellulose biosynthesis cyclic di-GMP-binding regulatory protein BcsB [Gordonia jinghuaiqii]|uniref:cellulose biosynthesis cyclic di-GMP-binding regulatory protein BcsB n=1 Tax=Gordonia jinghuaiqii TaxID=2758710 RepID=UPI001CB7A498|nr:cellulose biosynthesis cyclic di-GMP-binding regulatory protein BcsB [Gordonia jinghuaiqii]